MTGSMLEWAIIVFIIASLVILIWRGGAANPTGTGSLGRKVGKLSGEVTNLGMRVGHVEDDVEEIKRDGATSKDVEKLEAMMKGHQELAERTHRSVDRIERYLIEKGLGE